MNQGIVTIKGRQWYVDIPTTTQEMSQGLGGLSSIPVNTGMFFDMGVTQIASVTTQPMLFNIDIAFISADFVITQIERDVPQGLMVNSSASVRYWLETNANELSDIDVGDTVSVQISQAPPLGENYFSAILPIIIIGMMAAFMSGMIKKPVTKKTIPAPTPGTAIMIRPQVSEKEIRIALRRLPTRKLNEVCTKLSSGAQSGIPIFDENKDFSIRIAIEVLRERGKQPEYYTDTIDGVDKSMYRCQTELDDAFVNAISRIGGLKGVAAGLRHGR